MKNIIFVPVIAFACFAAQAQTYGELAYSATTVKENANGSSLKATPSVLRGIVGYEINPYLAVEGMASFGLIDSAITVNGKVKRT
jgi:ABC-type transporter MlaC component